MKKHKRSCETFEKAIENAFVERLGINKSEMKNPDIGSIAQAVNDTGSVVSIVLGLGIGATLALSIGSFGVGSIVGAAVAGLTFTVSKVDRKMKPQI